MGELIPISKNEINNEILDTVNARELWQKLEVKNEFNHWVKNRIEEAQLTDKVDFVSFRENTRKPQGGRPSVEYILTLDSAKHFAMLERNEIGKRMR